MLPSMQGQERDSVTKTWESKVIGASDSLTTSEDSKKSSKTLILRWKTKIMTTENESLPIELHYQAVKLPIGEVHANDWNPNFMATEVFKRLIDDIQQNGFLGSIILQKFNERMGKENVIIDGEHRWAALKKLGHTEIPCVVLEVDEQKSRALTIRLNAEKGEMLPNKIGEVFRFLSPENDVVYLNKITGFDAEDIKVLMDLQLANLDSATAPKKASKVKIDADKNVQCPSCGNKFQVYYK